MIGLSKLQYGVPGRFRTINCVLLLFVPIKDGNNFPLCCFQLFFCLCKFIFICGKYTRSLAHSLPHSHSLTPSFSHSFTPSLPPPSLHCSPRSFTPSLLHSLAPSLPRTLIPSFFHSLAPSLHCSLAPSLPRSFTPSLLHSLTYRTS